MFSASQIDCTPLDSQVRVCRHHTGASPVFFNRELVKRGRDRLTMLTIHRPMIRIKDVHKSMIRLKNNKRST